MTARDLPESLQAEQCVLGALLLSGEKSFDAVAGVLVGDDFETPSHRSIFSALAALFEVAQPLDPLTVWEYLGRPSDPDLAYLNALAANTPGASSVLRYAQMVRHRALLRRVGQIGADMAAAVGQRNADPQAIAGEAESALMTALDRAAGDPVSISQCVAEALARVQERHESGLAMSGIPTGFVDLDRLTGGFDAGQLIVLAARPSVGKTAMGLCIASAVAASGESVLFWTGEMSRQEIGARYVALRSAVPMHSMRSGRIADEHWPRFVDAQAGVASEKMLVDETPAVTVGYLRAKARKIKRRQGLGLIVADYIGLMRGTGENRVQEVGSISRGLKALAKELGVPILVLAQLNRAVEARSDKRPLLSDLRESGDIEQDADMVLMMHRESMYSDQPEWQGIAELLIRKNRNGPTGEVLLTWRDQIGMFTNSAAQSPRGYVKAAPKHRAYED